jgi:hypothetical protein
MLASKSAVALFAAQFRMEWEETEQAELPSKSDIGALLRKSRVELPTPPPNSWGVRSEKW